MKLKDETCGNCRFLETITENDSVICLIKSYEGHPFIIRKLTGNCELFILGKNTDLDHYIPIKIRGLR